MKTSAQVVEILRELMPQLREKYHVQGISLFGSVVRGEAKSTSDVDILVDFADDADLFDMSGLGLFLEERLGRAVDVVPRRALREELRAGIQAEAVSV